MKKFILAALLGLLLTGSQDLLGQEMTNSKEITDYITQHKWFLRRYEWGEKMFTVPKEYQGTYMVFLPQGKVYYYKKGDNENDRPRYEWKLSGSNRITITIHDGTKKTFGFKLEDFIGYQIKITHNGGEDDGLTYLWEEAGKTVSISAEKKIIEPLKVKDGKTYKTVSIGQQVWMAENLNTDRFRNGDIIPEAKTAAEWKKAGELGQPVWSYYDNDPKNGEKYGKLYNWYAINDSRGLAPVGYRIPEYEEWFTIGKFSHSDAGSKLKAPYYWNSPNTGATNSSGFSGVPGGYRNPEGDFYYLGLYGKWWTNTGFDVRARMLGLTHDNAGLWNSILNKSCGLSIRCIKE
jgi:uncharacterized protein (TIGR02145 family)